MAWSSKKSYEKVCFKTFSLSWFYDEPRSNADIFDVVKIMSFLTLRDTFEFFDTFIRVLQLIISTFLSDLYHRWAKFGATN